MFVVLLTMEKKWKNPKYSLTDERTKNTAYPYKTAKDVKRNKILINATTCLKTLHLGKRGQSSKTTHYVIPFIFNVQIERIFVKTENRLVIAWG
jgi:hypothetical protein